MIRQRTRRLSRRLGAYSRDAPSPASTDGRGWKFWQSDAEKEMQAFEQLGPLAREMFDYSLRDISIRNLMSKFVLVNSSGYDGDGPPPPRVVWTDRKFDLSFAQFVRLEYKRETGHDMVKMRLDPVCKRVAKRR